MNRSHQKPGEVSFTPRIRTETECLLSRYRELEPIAARVTRYNSGCILEEILILDLSMREVWTSAVDADRFLRKKQEESKEQSFLTRVATRLTGDLKPVDPEKKPLVIKSLKDSSLLSPEQLRIVRMSQNAYNAMIGVLPNGVDAGNAGGGTETSRAPSVGGRGKDPVSRGGRAMRGPPQ